MTTEKRRALRMLCKALLLTSLPLAGFVWAMPEDTTMLVAAGALTVISLAVGFGAEYLASSTENDLKELGGHMIDAHERRKDELEHREERLRQLDRIVNVLTDQNHTLRAKLVAVQVDVQRRKDALLQAASNEAAKLGDAVDTLRPGLSIRAN